MCRWPNGDLSFVSAEKEEDAIVMLDEWDNAEVAELTQVQNFMVDLRLTDGGELELQAFGEQSQDDIWDRAYPVLAQAKSSARETSTGDLASFCREMSEFGTDFSPTTHRWGFNGAHVGHRLL